MVATDGDHGRMDVIMCTLRGFAMMLWWGPLLPLALLVHAARLIAGDPTATRPNWDLLPFLPVALAIWSIVLIGALKIVGLP